MVDDSFRQPCSSRHWYLLAMVVILLAATAIRITDLETVPPGLQQDEAFHAHDAATVRHGAFSLWFSSNGGNEPLFMYLLAGTTALLGDNAFGIRFAAVICGLLTVALVYQWGRTLKGRQLGLYAALFMAVDFLPVWLSRVGLRVVTLVPIATLLGWLFTRALVNRPTNRRMILAGLVLGLGFYTYPAAVALAIIVAAFYGYLLIFRRTILKANWLGHALFWITAGLTYLPLSITLSRLQDGYIRIQQMSGTLRALMEGNPGFIKQGIRLTLLMWVEGGEPYWRYNVVGRGILNPVLATLFVVGIIVSLWFIWRGLRSEKELGHPEISQSAALLLIPLWLIGGMVPSAIASELPSNLRVSVALPAAYLTIGLALCYLRRWIFGLSLPRWAQGLWVLAVGVAATFTTADTIQSYFITWANNPEVQGIYRTDLMTIGDYMRGSSPERVAIGAFEPHNNDPFIFDFTPHGDTPIHWFDTTTALVIPAGDSPGWLFISPNSKPADRIEDDYLSQLPVIEDRHLDNGSRAFKLYELPTVDDFLEKFPLPPSQRIWAPQGTVFSPDDPASLGIPLTLPVQFGDVLQLIASQSPATVSPGGTVPLTLYWRVTKDITQTQNWSMFTHFITPDGQVITQRDFLGVPPATWRTGDVFIQLHDLSLDPAILPGHYYVQFGLYAWWNGQRFPVMVDGKPVGDRVILEPIEVVTP